MCHERKLAVDNLLLNQLSWWETRTDMVSFKSIIRGIGTTQRDTIDYKLMRIISTANQ